jgi:hypothetical protein
MSVFFRPSSQQHQNDNLRGGEKRFNQTTIEPDMRDWHVSVAVHHLCDVWEDGEKRKRLHEPRIAQEQNL